jgi:hypothetical protein
MSDQEQRDIARKILEALYDAWERHTHISLNTVQEQGGWEKTAFRTVVDKLENQQGLIKSAGSSYTFEITPDGINRAEESGILPEDKVQRHKNIRQHILAFLADLYDREGNRAHVHYEKIAEGAPVNNRMEILRDLSFLTDTGEIEAASTSSFRITHTGLRNYRGPDEDII